MYDFHDSTDTLKFWTEKRAINRTFFFHPILMKLGEIVLHNEYYNFTKFHQNQMKNKRGFFNSPFFCSEFQSVSSVVKIIHSAGGVPIKQNGNCLAISFQTLKRFTFFLFYKKKFCNILHYMIIYALRESVRNFIMGADDIIWETLCIDKFVITCFES